MVLGANVIGGWSDIYPPDIKVISELVFEAVFDAMEERAELEGKEANKRDEWCQVQERLRKPTYQELKQSGASHSGSLLNLAGFL